MCGRTILALRSAGVANIFLYLQLQDAETGNTVHTKDTLLSQSPGRYIISLIQRND